MGAHLPHLRARKVPICISHSLLNAAGTCCLQARFQELWERPQWHGPKATWSVQSKGGRTQPSLAVWEDAEAKELVGLGPGAEKFPS